MEIKENIVMIDKKKVASIAVLTTVSIAIILVGAILFASGLVYKTSFAVLNSKIPSAIFGIVISFLGIRYFMAVRKLKTELYKTAGGFQWSNFKKEKPQK